MSKKNGNGAVPVRSAKPIGKVVRVGDELAHPFEVGEIGEDNAGPYAVVELLGDRNDTDADKSVVKAIDAKENTVTLGDPSAAAHDPEKIGDAWAKDASTPDSSSEQVVKAKVDEPKKPKATFMSVAVRRSLSVQLSKSEIAEKADEAATTHQQIRELEEQKKSSAKLFADRIKDLRGDLAKAVEAHHTGEEKRTVECDQIFCLKSGKTWFDFQGRKHEERKMNDYEVRETNNTLFGDMQIEGALNSPDIEAAPDSPLVKPKTSEQLQQEAGERAREAAEKREAKKKPKKEGKSKGVTVESIRPQGSTDQDIADVMRDETSAKGKVDHVSSAQ